jgi:hypothetical protein
MGKLLQVMVYVIAALSLMALLSLGNWIGKHGVLYPQAESKANAAATQIQHTADSLR